MSGDYLLFMPFAEAPEGRDAAMRDLVDAGWRRAAATPGQPSAWVRGDRPPVCVLEDGTLVVGRAFERDGLSGGDGAGPAFARRLMSGRWGAYVALGRDADGERWLFRDPSGQLDAVAWATPSAMFVSNDLHLVPAALRPAARVDWDRVANFVRRPASLVGPVALTGLTAVAPGQALQMRSGRAVQLWTPAACVAAGVAGIGGDPDATLRSAVTETVSAWTGAWSRYLAEASGGFDSSVVSLLARAGPNGAGLLGLLNFHGDRLEGDERGWAEQVAAAAGRPLLAEGKAVRSLAEADLMELADGARPAVATLDPPRDRRTAEVAREQAAEGLLTGYGGDVVFYRMQSAMPVADLLRARAGPARVTGLALDIARDLRLPVWQVLWDAAFPGPRLRRDSSFLSPFFGPRAQAAAGAAVEHPWLEGVRRLPPGKQLQVLHLTVSQLALGRNRRRAAVEVAHPLLCQPVVEACLAIPSFRHLEGGVDRGLARRMFAPWLPPGVAARRSKGTLTSFYTRVVAASLPFLRPWLLDGRLVAEGVLDRGAVEQALDVDQLIWRGASTLLNAAVIEAWVCHWVGQAAPA
jgi:asparagine synthase (glutamine-hydrolysing)